ncbi:hypothetical protein DEO72_LG3g923 [Vigna unguiculata]|uniref:Uncharacterized protein n=1 Tax=Vigna unguiculata TaxID=3917 RepID=A0A4D6LCS7_VIGUN|nr:hypothetical protein DEO72_LG3g923 [Vigna unguiculata]
MLTKTEVGSCTHSEFMNFSPLVSDLVFSPRRVALAQAKTPENPPLILREVSPRRAEHEVLVFGLDQVLDAKGTYLGNATGPGTRRRTPPPAESSSPPVSDLVFSPRRVALAQAKTPENPPLILREVSPRRAEVA